MKHIMKIGRCLERSGLLTLIWVGFLGVHFEVGGEGKIITPPPCLKLVRIMLKTSNLARKYTSICSFRKYTF